MPQDLQTIESILDLNNAMENLDGDSELLAEVLEIFLEMAPEQLDALEAAIREGKTADVNNMAHSIKGSASNFCAVKFVDTACRMEQLAKGGSLDGAVEMMSELRADFEHLLSVQADINWDEVLQAWNS